MSRVISFYFIEEDEQSFLQILNPERVLILRSDPGRERLLVIYDEFSLNPCTQVTHSQALLCRRGDETGIRFMETRDGDQYFIDCECSPVIEFTRSGYDAGSNTLVSGRLWYEHSYSDMDKHGQSILFEKAEGLLWLYERLVRWIEKNCRRLPNGSYIAPHAAELYAQGAKLSP
jgi:hypothetical protein